MMRRIAAASLLLAVASLAQAVNMPPVNSYLAKSSYSMAHGNPAQQDAAAQAGSPGPSRTLSADQIQYQHVGPAHFGAVTSGIYADGKRVFWSNGVDRIVKIDYDTWELVAEYFFPGAEVYEEEHADEVIASFDAGNDGLFALVRSFQEMNKLRDLANLYTVLDKDHIYYVGSKTGMITAYGDADPTDTRSAIVKKAELQLPPQVTGPAGKGWVRNPFAVDDDGGIYIASQEHMHKVVWTGDKLSVDEADGAWTSPYLNSWGQGSGVTPSLMGFRHVDRRGRPYSSRYTVGSRALECPRATLAVVTHCNSLSLQSIISPNNAW